MSAENQEKNRQQILIDLYKQYLLNEMTLGQMIIYLRKNILEMSQQEYADYVGISRRTLTNIEQDNDKLTQSVLNKVLKPLGMKVGIIPTYAHVIQKIIDAPDKN